MTRPRDIGPGATFVHDWPASRVILAAGALAQVPAEVDRLGGDNVLLISDASTREVGSRVRDSLDGRIADWIDEVVMHVPAGVAEAAVARAGKAEATVLVCVGGGSATGLAKAVAKTTALPIIAVPTTYAGSEMTSIWGLTDDGRKVTGRAEQVRPRTVIYDPELSVSLPFGLSVTSGVNAIAHCSEALYSTAQSPLAVLSAGEGIRAIGTALTKLRERPTDLTARALALRGAWLAGWSLNVSEMGLHHRICHVLGGKFDLPHAPLHSVVLPYVLGFTAGAAPSAMTVIADALTELAGARPEPPDVGTALWDACGRLGVAVSLADIGLGRAQLGPAIDAVSASIADKPPAHPRAAGLDDVTEMLTRAWSGAVPATA